MLSSKLLRQNEAYKRSRKLALILCGIWLLFIIVGIVVVYLTNSIVGEILTTAGAILMMGTLALWSEIIISIWQNIRKDYKNNNQ